MTAGSGEPTPSAETFTDTGAGTFTAESSRSEWVGSQDIRIPNRPRGSLTSTVTCNTCGHAVTLRPGDSINFDDPRLCEHMGGLAR